MSETQHTPGPWLVMETDTSIKVRTGHRDSICIMSIKPYSGRIEEGRANAHLIASAPDMLAALTDARVERDRLREALDDIREDLLKAQRGLDVPDHKLNDVVFCRAAASIGKSFVDAALAKEAGK